MFLNPAVLYNAFLDSDYVSVRMGCHLYMGIFYSLVIESTKNFRKSESTIDQKFSFGRFPIIRFVTQRYSMIYIKEAK